MKLNPFVQKLGSTHTEITFLPVPRKSERVKKMKIYVWHRVKLPSWLPELITIALWLGLKQFCSPASFFLDPFPDIVYWGLSQGLFDVFVIALFKKIPF